MVKFTPIHCLKAAQDSLIPQSVVLSIDGFVRCGVAGIDFVTRTVTAVVILRIAGLLNPGGYSKRGGFFADDTIRV